jgi:hypothetical protein
MEEVKQYFDKAYGKEHIKNVVDLKDLDSIYWLMQEYAESKQSPITAVVQAKPEKICGSCGETNDSKNVFCFYCGTYHEWEN